MADVADIANDIAAETLERQLAEHRRKAQRPVIECLYCFECGVDIPLARREAVAGCTTCIDCQTILEVRRG